jgi:hypothetical protein
VGVDQFVVNLRAEPVLVLGPVLDVCFVSGYSQPAIAVLEETGLLPIGHAAKIQHTCMITVFSVDTRLKVRPHNSVFIERIIHYTFALPLEKPVRGS